MLAEIQRLEDAARTAMGDYSQFGSQMPVRSALLDALASSAARLFAMFARFSGKPVA